MTEILYGESSSLLASLTIEEFQQFQIRTERNREEFIRALLESPPLMIFIGDSLSTDLDELVFSLKNLPDIREIPLIFIGEHERSFLFPGVVNFDRKSLASETAKVQIAQLLYRRRNTVQDGAFPGPGSPEGVKPEELIQTHAKDSLLNQIHEAYCLSELSSVNITAGEEFIRKMLGQIMMLLHTDFAFLRFSSQDGPVEFCCLAAGVDSIPEAQLHHEALRFIDAGMPAESEFGSQITYLSPLVIPETRGIGLIFSGILEREAVKLTSATAQRLTELVIRIIFNSNRFQKKERDTNAIFRAFTRFLPVEIINDLLIKDSTEDLMTGENRTIVVLFCHVRQFDLIMRENSPDQVVAFLNAHFTRMVDIIQKHGGAIDKFIGDAVYAIFGAPVSHPDNAERAARAALEMIARYPDTDTSGMKLPPGGFSIGVGLNEGKAIIGNIGCSVKFDYTAIGDTVNLAARLESLTKHYKVPILISEEVRLHLGESFYSRLVDIARVKGKSESTRIYSLETEPGKFSEEWRDFYEKGIRMYIIGNWRIALKYLTMALELIPGDFPTQQYFERCTRFQTAPPEEFWEGAVTLDFK